MTGVDGSRGLDGEEGGQAISERPSRDTLGRRKSGKQVGKADGERSGGAETTHEEGEELLLGKLLVASGCTWHRLIPNKSSSHY